MSITYPSYTKSRFPDELDNFSYFSDVTSDLIPYVNQYKTYYQSGNINAAAQILIDHPEIQPCMINASNLNNIIDALKCIEEYYKNDIHNYVENVGASYDNTSSGSSETTIQGALDDLYSKTSSNTSTINNYSSTISALNSDINTINTKLEGIETGAEANTVLGVKGNNEGTYRTGLINITKDNIGLSNVDNTADANKSVNYATSSGSANTANSATTSANCTGNSDTVDGYHIQTSTTELTAGTSSLSTNVLCFVYE